MVGPAVSVIIPVHNGGENFERCLASVREALLPSSELIVVVDGPDPASHRLAQKYTPKVLQLPVPHGPDRARNWGAEQARGEILLFLDADVAVPAGLLHEVIGIFENQPDLSALIGSYDDEPGAQHFLSQYRNLLHHYIHQISRENAFTFWGACGAIRRKIFQRLGGFDESYGFIGDIGLGYRLKLAGLRLQLCKTLRVKHLKQWKFWSLLQTDLCDRAFHWSRLILEHRLLIPDLNLRYSSQASVLLTGVFLAALTTGFIHPFFLFPAALAALLLIFLNWPLYRFFAEKRGFWFAARSIPCHWLYFLCAGLGFLGAFLSFPLSGQKNG